ncbi:MAG: PilZ domain-containing protein [Deltaproteobacteria bacterium]|nr:PilZ domain-containing protein [Deltaproteobacteria bacterium]
MGHVKLAEQRKFHRIATDQVISFAEIDRPELLGVSKNISTGGISFEVMGVEINLGDILRVTFNVGDQTIVASGEVVWATDTDPITQEVGIEFHEIDARAIRLLEDAIGPSLEPIELY